MLTTHGKMRALALVWLFFVLEWCNAERIVVLGVLGTKSHKISYMPIAEALAAKGHQVTVFSPYKATKTVSNLREVQIKNAFDEHPFNMFEYEEQNYLTVTMNFISDFSDMTKEAYEAIRYNEEFLRIIDERDVDLFIIDGVINDFMYPFPYHMKLPFILYSAPSEMCHSVEAMGIPKYYASVPEGSTDLLDEMDFFERMTNMISCELMLLIKRYGLNGPMEKLVALDFPHLPSLETIERNASLLLINHNSVTSYNRPFPPNVIPISGLHIRPSQPLPKDLQEYADQSTNGFVVVSFGSIVKGSSMPKKHLDTFLDVFSKIPQRVIWKWESSPDFQVPANVLILDWLPQQDLLAHENCRLFIYHGGIMGLQEAAYNAVPVVGLPFLFSNDNLFNIAKAKKEGYAEKISWADLNEENLLEAVNRLINEPSYQLNAQRVSRLLRDEMMPAKDVAVYWVEHVLRHGGAHHLALRSQTMPFYQTHLIDVILFLVVLVALFVVSAIWLLVFCLRRITRRYRVSKVKKS